MKKHVFGRQLGRDANERKALFKSLASALVMEEKIKTTHAKAKAVRPYVEKLVTKARTGEAAFRLVEPFLTRPAAQKLVSEVAPRFVGRPGGYTRIVYAGTRIADNASVAVIEFVEKGQPKIAPAKKDAKKAVKATAKKKDSKPAAMISKKESK